MTEQDNKSPVQEAPPMKLDVSVRAIEPKGDLSEISVKFLLIHDSPSSHGNASHASIASIPSLRF